MEHHAEVLRGGRWTLPAPGWRDVAATLIVVEKPSKPDSAAAPAPEFCSPVSGAPVRRLADCWYCSEDGHAFPIIAGVPCLTPENAIVASKLDRFV